MISPALRARFPFLVDSGYATLTAGSAALLLVLLTIAGRFLSADDYGRDPIAGELVFSNAHEIAIKRSDPAVGDVVVHFPRAGFVVMGA